MNCPVCGKETNPTSPTCIHCGASLIGPRSIDLDMPESKKETYRSNNLQKITGIDINQINRDEYVFEDNTKKKRKKGLGLNFSIPSLIMMALSALLLITFLVLFFINTKKEQCPKCKNDTTTQILNKGYTGIYSFIIPDDYIYISGNDTLITDTKTNIIINTPVKSVYNDINNEELKQLYLNAGYENAEVIEDKIENRPIKYVKFHSPDHFFADYYFQYSDDTVIYGQVSSVSEELITKEVKEIIHSIEINENQNISVSRAAFDYTQVFKNKEN